MTRRFPGTRCALHHPEYLEYLRSAGAPAGLLRGADPSAFQILAAQLAGETVATAIAFDHDGDCGVFNMSTLEAARRQGLATSLTARHVHDDIERGCSTASLQATAMAERVYAAVGFRDLGRILEYAKVMQGAVGTLPHVNPDGDPDGGPVPAPVADLHRRLADADAVLFCTPEYGGSLPGSFKNLLDWTVGGGETYGKPVAWINASSRPDPDAGSGAHAAQCTVLGYTGPADVAAAACRRIRVRQIALGTAVESLGLTSLVLPLRTLAVILVVVPAVVFVVAPALTRLFAGRLGADRPAAC